MFTKIEFLTFKEFFAKRKTDCLIYTAQEEKINHCTGWITKYFDLKYLEQNKIYYFDYIGRAKIVDKTVILFPQ